MIVSENAVFEAVQLRFEIRHARNVSVATEEEFAKKYLHYCVHRAIEDFEASEEMDRLVRDDPQVAWAVTKLAIEKAPTDAVLAYIAAGPLEDLLKRNGPEIIDETEHLARVDDHMRFAVCGVWIDQRFPVCSRVHELIREFAPQLEERLAAEC